MKLRLFLLMALCLSGMLYSQTITNAEYFIDTDPGFGNGTQVSITSGEDIIKDFTVDISSLDAGFHSLYVRVQDSNGKWSLSSVRPFFKENIPALVTPNIVALEYFIDIDPGLGNGTQVSITSGEDIEKDFAVDISSLSAGFHSLYVRMQDSNEKWSLFSVRPFLKENIPADITPDIITLEYFFDSDPGFGQGTAVNIEPGQDITKTFIITSDTLSDGLHRLYIRVKDASNVWSLANTDTFSGPLPVELVSFTALAKHSIVELKWSTATEMNNYGFEIQRSENRSQMSEAGGQWANVGFVEGSGTTNAPKEYSFTDKNLKEGKYLYRLKQIDRDGKFEYSQEVEVMISQIPQMYALMQNYPNPFNPSTVINYQLPVNSFVTLKIFDMLGREVAELVNEEKSAGRYSVQLSVNSYQLSSGIYFYRLQAGNFVATKKLLLMK